MALRQKLVAGVATAALSLGGAFGVVNDADAQSAQPTPAVSTQQVSVPVLNGRGLSDAYLRITAARDSKDAVLIVVFGNNRTLYDQVKKAAADVTAEGYPVKGIIVANGPEAVEVYADAQVHSVHSSPSRINTEGFLAETRGSVREAYSDIIMPRRQRVAQTPTIASTFE